MENKERPSSSEVPRPTSWVEYTTPDGRVYYFSTETRTTTWEKPDELKPAKERTSVWKEYVKDGRAYWYNTETKTSTWSRPAELGSGAETPAPTGQPIAAVDKAAELAKEPLAIAGPSQSKQPLRPKSPAEANSSQRSVRQQHFAPPNAVPERQRMARREFRTHQEAEQAFFDLLLAHKVGSDWTWEQTLREIASDPDYRSLKSLQERKDAFYKYTDKLREREQEEKRERAKQQRDNFFAMLKDMPISQVTRFRKIKHLAAEHPAFIAAGRESERLFGEFMDEFIRETKERRRAVRNEAMHKLSEHFVGLPISAKWSDVKAELLHKFSHLLMPALRAPADPSAVPVDTPYMLGSEADPEAGLCMLDFMDAFERAIADAEKREAEERQREKDGILGSQRQRRDGFRQLLEEHNSWFTPSSTWTQFYPLIKADPRYIEILGQPGSTPLELFWDKVELLDEDVYRERKRLEAAMHEHGFRVHTGTTIDEVKKFVADTCSITDSYLDYIFEQVLMKARRKKEEEDERLQRQRCRLMDDFKYALLDLSPALDARSTWEVDKGRIARLPEYRDLADEAAGREVFGRIIEREKEKELASAAQYSRDLESHKRLRSSPEVASPPGGRIVRPRTGSRGNASSNARHSPTHHASSGNVHNEGHDSELEEGEMVV